MRTRLIRKPEEIQKLIHELAAWAVKTQHGIQNEPWWLESWLETMPFEFLSVVVEDSKGPAAAGFFQIKQKSLAIRGLIKARTMEFMSQGPADFSFPLIRPGANHEHVSLIMGQFISAIPGIDVIDLQQIPEDWPGLVGLSRGIGVEPTPIVRVHSVDLGLGYEKLWLRAGRNLRRDISKKRRKLRARCQVQQEAIRSMTPELFQEIQELNRIRLPRRSPFTDDRLVFLEQALKRGSDAERITVFTMRCSGKLISYRLVFVQDKTIYDWNTSYHPDMFDLSVGKIHLADIIKWCVDNGFESFNFMRGDEDYKRVWSTDISWNMRIFKLLDTKRISAARLWAKIRKTPFGGKT